MATTISTGVTTTPVTPTTTAQAATNKTYSGTLAQPTSGQAIKWTLENGTLTLQAGTPPKFSWDDEADSLINTTEKGRLLDALSASSPDLTSADFQTMVTSIDITGKIDLQTDASFFFSNFHSVTSYHGLNNLIVSQVNDAAGGFNFLFANNYSLRTFTIPQFADANDHSFRYGFYSDSSLINLDGSQLDTSHISDFGDFALECPNLKTLNLTNFPKVSYYQFISGGSEGTKLRNLTLSPNVNLLLFNTSTWDDQGNDVQIPIGFNAPEISSKFTGKWQAVSPGKVSFNNNDPLTGYQTYDPQGKTYTNQELIDLYTPGATDTPTGNVTYVWEPTDAYRATFNDTNTDNSGSTGTSDNTSSSISSIDTTTTTPDTSKFQSFSVTAIRKVGLYRSENFSTTNRIQWYVKKPQMKRPTFTVIGTAISKNAAMRYHVRDTNRQSSSYGQTGYLTTQAAYVNSTYYQSKPTKITVINPRGINGYSRVTLNKFKKHYIQGTQLNVKKIVTHNQTMRFVLSNGQYITANRHLVITGRYQMPAKVQAKTALNRYKTANLTGRNRHYPKRSHHTFKVLGWDYSHGSSQSTAGTLRYRVASGYISANSRLVKTVK